MPRSTPSLREQVHALLKQATGYGNTYEAQFLFAGMTGSLQLAVMINQLLYWSERATRPDGSVYKTSADWEEECKVSGYAVRQFKKLPFIETTVHRANTFPTTHYRIRGDILLQMVTQYLAALSNPASPDDDQFDSTDRRDRQQSLSISTTTSVETYKTLTDITSDTTPAITTTRGPTQKNAPPGHSDTDLRGREVIKTEKEAQREDTLTSDATIAALAEVTGFDPQLHSHAIRLGRVARELMQGGYTPDTIRSFRSFWRAKDFRWKKDHQLPTPEDVLEQIPRSKRTYADELRDSWRDLAWNQYKSTGEK